MIYLLIIYILVGLAAMFNAFMDTFENTPNFNKSIFKNLDKKFWCKDVSWQYVKKIFAYPLDAWHLSKSAMIFCIIGAICIAIFMPKMHMWWWTPFVFLGLTWNIVFWMCYIKIFRGVK